MNEQPLPTDAERAAFEAWALENRYEPGHKGRDGSYLGAATAHAWAGWQAARRTPPAVAGEPVAWYEYNADLDAWFLAYRRNPKAKTRPLVFGDSTPQAQAGAVPLTDEQIEALPLWKRFVGLWPETRREIVRTIEHHHGIKGGQHG